jgi:hypothetical protein
MMATELRQAVVNPRAGGTFGAHFYGFDKGSDPGWRDGSGEIVDLDSGQIYFVAPTETRDQGAGQDVCVIGYWVQDVDGDPEPGKLMRYCLSDDGVGWNTFDPDANIASQDLGINVQSLTFEFWDPGNEGWDNAADNWRSDQAGPPQENSLPRAVRITLVVWDPTLEPNADPTDPKVRKRFMTFTTVVQLDAAR